MARKAESGNLYFGVVLASLALGAGVAVGRGPWVMWKEQQKRAEHQVALMRDSERTRETLVREEARLRSPVGREEQARDNGWLLPNERPAEPVGDRRSEAGGAHH